eukprot:4621252-Prymnesium_polylepis.2
MRKVITSWPSTPRTSESGHRSARPRVAAATPASRSASAASGATSEHASGFFGSPQSRCSRCSGAMSNSGTPDPTHGSHARICPSCVQDPVRTSYGLAVRSGA